MIIKLSALANIGPLGISVQADTWFNYETGIFTGCNQTVNTLDHNVQLIGYGEENGQPYWLVKNSWGPGYGEGGYIRLSRSNPDLCTVDPAPEIGSGCTKDDDGQPITVCGACGILYDANYVIGATTVAGDSYTPTPDSVTSACSSSSDATFKNGAIAAIVVLAVLLFITLLTLIWIYYRFSVWWRDSKQQDMSKRVEF
jgi:hypothetical protein